MCKVSIVLPCYNHGEYVAQAIQSVLDQTYTDFELLVFDNGSSDDSWEVINTFYDPRIRKFKIEKNSFLAVKQQFVQNAKGEYFAIMHSDDVWLDSKLQKQMELFKNNSEARVSFTWSVFVDENLNPIGLDFNEKNKSQKEWWDTFLIGENHMSMPSFVCEREIYERIIAKLYPYRQVADYYMWMLILEEMNIYMVEEVLVKQRIHNSGKSAKNESYRTNEVIARTEVEFFHMMFRLLDEMPDKVFMDNLCCKNFDDSMSHLDVMCEKFLYMYNARKTFLKKTEYAICYYNKYFEYEYNGNIFFKYLEEKYAFTREDFFELTGRNHIQKPEDLAANRWSTMANIDFSTIRYPKNLSIYGCGRIGKVFSKKIESFCNIEQFIDQNPRRDDYDGIPIKSVNEAIIRKNSFVVVVPTYDYEDIKKVLLSRHAELKEENIVRFDAFLATGDVIDPEF